MLDGYSLRVVSGRQNEEDAISPDVEKVVSLMTQNNKYPKRRTSEVDYLASIGKLAVIVNNSEVVGYLLESTLESKDRHFTYDSYVLPDHGEKDLPLTSLGSIISAVCADSEKAA